MKMISNHSTPFPFPDAMDIRTISFLKVRRISGLQRRRILPSLSQMQHSLSSRVRQVHCGAASFARYGRECEC